MKNATFDSFDALLDEIGRALDARRTHGARAVATMSLAGCWSPASRWRCAITILPLAIFLFVMFMAPHGLHRHAPTARAAARPRRTATRRRQGE